MKVLKEAAEVILPESLPDSLLVTCGTPGKSTHVMNPGGDWRKICERLQHHLPAGTGTVEVDNRPGPFPVTASY